jgi:hypothetical protein
MVKSMSKVPEKWRVGSEDTHDLIFIFIVFLQLGCSVIYFYFLVIKKIGCYGRIFFFTIFSFEKTDEFQGGF